MVDLISGIIAKLEQRIYQDCPVTAIICISRKFFVLFFLFEEAHLFRIMCNVSLLLFFLCSCKLLLCSLMLTWVNEASMLKIMQGAGADPGIENGGLLMCAQRAKFFFKTIPLSLNHTPFSDMPLIYVVNNSVNIL